MTPDERKAARAAESRIGLGFEMERAKYLRLALWQIDADEALMRQALLVIDETYGEVDWLWPLAEQTIIALRARLGEEPAPEEKP